MEKLYHEKIKCNKKFFFLSFEVFYESYPLTCHIKFKVTNFAPSNKSNRLLVYQSKALNVPNVPPKFLGKKP